jgi:hypothetical protein
MAALTTKDVWSCAGCGNRAFNTRNDRFGPRVTCAYCHTQEYRTGWACLALYGTPLPDPERRAALVAETGAWACISCFGTTTERGLHDLRCGSCGTPELDYRMRRLAGMPA